MAVLIQMIFKLKKKTEKIIQRNKSLKKIFYMSFNMSINMSITFLHLSREINNHPHVLSLLYSFHQRGF